jgi:hypothetical protein
MSYELAQHAGYYALNQLGYGQLLQQIPYSPYQFGKSNKTRREQLVESKEQKLNMIKAYEKEIAEIEDAIKLLDENPKIEKVIDMLDKLTTK